MAWVRRIIGTNLVSTLAPSAPYSSRFFSKSTPYIAKVGIPEFLNGIGNGVESHVAKLETEIGDFQKLLVCRTLKLKKLGIPCKHAAGYGHFIFGRNKEEVNIEIRTQVQAGIMEAAS